MINPTFQDTITLYHQHKYFNEETKRYTTEWVRTIHEECYFGTQEAQALNGTTLSLASGYTVRIPYNGATVQASSGDIIVRGKVTDEISDTQGQRATDLLEKYKPNAFTVRAFKDNTKLSHGAHYKLTGV